MNVQAQRHGRASTLTYRRAPRPQGCEEALQLVILFSAGDDRDWSEADARDVSAADPAADGPHRRRGWLSRAWRTLCTFQGDQRLASRQADFALHFSRQMEQHASTDDGVVLVSARAAVLSMGQPVRGTLYVTRCGLYFACDIATASAPTEHAGQLSNPTPQPLDQNDDGVSDADGDGGTRAAPEPCGQRPPARDEASLKEFVDYLRMAAVLPSVCFPARSSAATVSAPVDSFYLEGVPSPVVAPNAIQIFAAHPNQIYQFICIFDVAVAPPSVAVAAVSTSRRSSPSPQVLPNATTTGTIAASDAHFTEAEYCIVRKVAAHVQPLVLCIVLHRLMLAARRHCLQEPSFDYVGPPP